MNASTLYIYSDGYEVTMFFFCWYLNVKIWGQWRLSSRFWYSSIIWQPVETWLKFRTKTVWKQYGNHIKKLIFWYGCWSKYSNFLSHLYSTNPSLINKHLFTSRVVITCYMHGSSVYDKCRPFSSTRSAFWLEVFYTCLTFKI